MTSIETVAASTKPSLWELVRRQLARLSGWLNEEVVSNAVPEQRSLRDWADLPTYHPAESRHSR